MASVISNMLHALFPATQFRGLLIGLDASGKTSVLYKLKLGECITTMPTIGFNVETITVSGIEFTMWDVGGCDKIRPLWRHYYKNTQGLVFIVDCSDNQRFGNVVSNFKVNMYVSSILLTYDCLILLQTSVASYLRIR